MKARNLQWKPEVWPQKSSSCLYNEMLSASSSLISTHSHSKYSGRVSNAADTIKPRRKSHMSGLLTGAWRDTARVTVTGTIVRSCLMGPLAEEQIKQLTEGCLCTVEYGPKWRPRLCHYHRMTITPVETPVAEIQLLEQVAPAPMSLQGREEKGWVGEKNCQDCKCNRGTPKLTTKHTCKDDEVAQLDRLQHPRA